MVLKVELLTLREIVMLLVPKLMQQEFVRLV
jgi:hypothetical protein